MVSVLTNVFEVIDIGGVDGRGVRIFKRVFVNRIRSGLQVRRPNAGVSLPASSTIVRPTFVYVVGILLVKGVF